MAFFEPTSKATFLMVTTLEMAFLTLNTTLLMVTTTLKMAYLKPTLNALNASNADDVEGYTDLALL